MVKWLASPLLPLVVLVSPALAQDAPPIAENAAPASITIAADEARQGVASDGTFVYAVDNNRIGKYRISDGEKVASWEGDKALFPHMNSCTIVGAELVCAASNHSSVPQTSAIEFFDAATLSHIRSYSLGIGTGSLTVLDYYDGSWWAVFANYDGRGGEPTRDHRYTQLVQMDANFQRQQAWTFPPEVLAKFAPMSCSGASWGEDGLLYVSGHDLPEIYALQLPEAGSVLELVKAVPVTTRGQAIDWDPAIPGRIWSISRTSKTLVASKIN